MLFSPAVEEVDSGCGGEISASQIKSLQRCNDIDAEI
jgi:hypothetical protein